VNLFFIAQGFGREETENSALEERDGKGEI
jgi:hypothetical protein